MSSPFFKFFSISPGLLSMASGGALALRLYYITITLFRQAPFRSFSVGEVLFLPCFIHAHFSYYVRYTDTYRQSTTQGHGNTHKHGENRIFLNKTLHRSILVERLTLQKYNFVAFVSGYPVKAAFCVRYTWTRAGSRCTWSRLAGSEAGPLLGLPGLGDGRFCENFV
jgi:hypothetical protein